MSVDKAIVYLSVSANGVPADVETPHIEKTLISSVGEGETVGGDLYMSLVKEPASVKCELVFKRQALVAQEAAAFVLKDILDKTFSNRHDLVVGCGHKNSRPKGG